MLLNLPKLMCSVGDPWSGMSSDSKHHFFKIVLREISREIRRIQGQYFRWWLKNGNNSCQKESEKGNESNLDLQPHEQQGHATMGLPPPCQKRERKKNVSPEYFEVFSTLRQVILVVTNLFTPSRGNSGKARLPCHSREKGIFRRRRSPLKPNSSDTVSRDLWKLQRSSIFVNGTLCISRHVNTSSVQLKRRWRFARHWPQTGSSNGSLTVFCIFVDE